ncbi:hypothetical protein Trydic_g11696 [Trypoxylus dichotomus]
MNSYRCVHHEDVSLSDFRKDNFNFNEGGGDFQQSTDKSSSKAAIDVVSRFNVVGPNSKGLSRSFAFEEASQLDDSVLCFSQWHYTDAKESFSVVDGIRSSKSFKHFNKILWKSNASQ